VILGAKVGASFQVHVFDDPEVEIPLESGGLVKIVVLERFHLFHTFTNLVSLGTVLGHMLVSLGSPGNTFYDFRGHHNRDRGRDRDRATLDPRLRQDSKLRVMGLG